MSAYDVESGSPDGWREVLRPLGALWLATAALGVVLGQAGWPELGQAGTDALAAVDRLQRHGGVALAGTTVAMVLAWAAAGLVASALGRVAEAFWLGGWGAPGWLAARRRTRWERVDRAVDEARRADDAAAELRAILRRNTIALTPPTRPTWFGDRWAALELRVWEAYGLDLVAAWPRLWLVMPRSARVELRAAKAGWDRATVLAAWSMLYALLAAVWWPALGIGAALALAGWVRARAALSYRADLIEAAFDLYSAALGARLAPDGTGLGRLDPQAGRRVTAALRKGS